MRGHDLVIETERITLENASDQEYFHKIDQWNKIYSDQLDIRLHLDCIFFAMDVHRQGVSETANYKT